MSMLSCNCQCRCTFGAIIASVILGIIAAFLQITGVITATTVFLWVALGIAVVYLAILLLKSDNPITESCVCICTTIGTLLMGILGTILLSVILLAVGIVATSVVSAILVGLLVIFLSLIFTSTACLIKARTGCGD